MTSGRLSPSVYRVTDLSLEQAMSAQTDVDDTLEGGGQDALAETQRGIVERLADPYLTDHDRWVLRQFALFLSGTTPGPDPRMAPAGAGRPLQHRTRSTTVSATLGAEAMS
jgi:hypothetical protein